MEPGIGVIPKKDVQLSYTQQKVLTTLKVVAFTTVACVMALGAVGAFVPQQSLPSFLRDVIGTIGYEGAISCMTLGAFIIFLCGIIKTVKKINQIQQKKLEQKSTEKINDKVREIGEYAQKNHLQPYEFHGYEQSNNLYTVFYAKNMLDGSTTYLYVENCNSIDEGKEVLLNKLNDLTDQTIRKFNSTELEDLKIYRFQQENERRYTYFFRNPGTGRYFFIDDCDSNDQLSVLQEHLDEIKKQLVDANAGSATSEETDELFAIETENHAKPAEIHKYAKKKQS